jgi:hypothetical protein
VPQPWRIRSACCKRWWCLGSWSQV